MNIYLEYKDEKSAKFWKISVDKESHTVTYGKIGTDGQTKTKTFESPEKALKEAEKLVKAKSKKGYQEVASAEEATPLQFQFLEEEAARERFNLKQYDPLGGLRYDAIVLIEGNVALEKGLFDSSIAEALFNGERTTKAELIIIEGNLTIKGDLSISGETGYPSLLVLGDVHCDSLYSNDNVMHMAGDAYIKHLFYGDYNHGAIKIAGTTYAPYIINSDHHSDLTPSDKAIVINVYSDDDDSFNYDYYSSDLPEVMIEEVLEYDEDYEEYDFDIGLFAEVVEAGKSPFKKGAKPSRDALANEITALAGKNGEGLKELDLSEKKLLQLPAALFEMKTLEVLNLSKNDFTVLPEEIGQLTNLRELNLGTTRIEELPASIANLKHLEVLNLRYCRQLKSLPEAISELTSLKSLNLHAYKGVIPKSMAKLDRLEELNITRINLMGQIALPKPIAFPEWVGELKGLKKLHARENAFTNLPKALSKLSTLEFLDLESSISCLKEVTDLSVLQNLKELQVNGYSTLKDTFVLQEVLQHFFAITSLEKLSIARFDEFTFSTATARVENRKEQLKDNPEELALFESKLTVDENGDYRYTKRPSLSKKHFKGLEQLVHLKELIIVGTIADGLPEEIAQLPQLQRIRIETQHFSEEDKKALKSLKVEVF